VQAYGLSLLLSDREDKKKTVEIVPTDDGRGLKLNTVWRF
jgi:hypothetical protein